MNTHITGRSETDVVEYRQYKGIYIDSISVDLVSESNVYWAISSFKHSNRGTYGIFPAQLEQFQSYIKVWLVTIHKRALQLSYM